MVSMWAVSSFLVWAICAHPDAEAGVKRMPFLHALAIGACIKPTDPILAATVVKGRWAGSHVPARLAQLIWAESGANDGLGYPFLYFALYLIKYVGGSGQYLAKEGGAGKAMEMFFGETVSFVVLLSIAWGVAVGYAARKGLKFAESLKYVDKESFYSFALVLAVLLIGTCGMVGSDDILACFVAGNVLSWDDWSRRKTATDSFEPTVDMLLSMSIFIYFGAVCPWQSFAPHIRTESLLDSPLPAWRLICLGISILALRGVPAVVALYLLGWLRPHVSSLREAGFIGFFGPIGVSAIFYLHVLLEYLRKDVVSKSGSEEPRADVRELFDVARVCIWFVVVCSVIVHGLSNPSYQSDLWIAHHLWKRVPDEHRYSIRAWLVQERDALKYHVRLSRLRDEEERIKHARLWLRHAPVRPAPSFRRVRMHLEQEASRPQELPQHAG